MTPSVGPFFDIFDSDYFGFGGLWLQNAPWTLVIILLLIIIAVSLANFFFSKALHACSQLLTMKQMISLRGECQKSNKELKECEPDAVTCECHTQISAKAARTLQR